MDTPKVLIADSNETFRLALSEALQQDFPVLCCRSGKEALALLRAERPDLLVLDLMLPELDGLLLLEQAAADGLHPTVLVVTRQVTDYVLDAAAELGIDYIMVKPCEISSVTVRLRDLVRKGKCTPPELRLSFSELLGRLGIHDRLEGYAFLLEAVPLKAKFPEMPYTKHLYPAVGKKFGRKGSTVERLIRHALESGWKNGDQALWRRYFPNRTARPTNAEFLSRMAAYLQEEWEAGGGMIP